MRLQSNLFSALCGLAAVSAEFAVITDGPMPTPIPPPSVTDAAGSSSWSLSIEQELLSRVFAWATAQPLSALNSIMSAESELENFVATATYDIPPVVTDKYSAKYYTTVPEWYSALPSDVKTFNDEVVSLERSILADMGYAATTTPAEATNAAPKAAAPGYGLLAAAVAVAALL